MPRGHVTDFIAVALRRGGWVRSMRRAEALLAWPRVVGRTVARFARAVGYDQGTLVVEVDDAETAMHLGLQRTHILEAYARLRGEAPVRELRFRVGRGTAVEATPERENPPSDPSPIPADPAEIDRLLRAIAALPETLVPSAERASRALALWRARKRALGWVPCTICTVLTEPTGEGEVRCPVCRRHATSPRVHRVAERWVVDPAAAAPSLTDEEARVARALAAERARAAVLELVPHAISNPAMLPALATAIRCAVALRRGVTLVDVPDLRDVDAERDGIDPRALMVIPSPLEES